MKKIILTVVFLVNILNIFASEKLDIVVTNFPNYEFVREVGGDRIDVELLLPFGIEPHSYEPSPKDIVKMNKSDLLVYTNEVMEPWVAKLENSLDVKTLNISKNLHLEEGSCEHDHHEDHEDHHHDEHEHDYDDKDHHHDEHEHDYDDKDHHHEDHEDHHHDEHEHDYDDKDHHHEDHEDHHDHGTFHHDEDESHNHEHNHEHGLDPHVWTDPFLVLEMIDTLVEELSMLDPENKDIYVENGKNYKKEINKLHRDFKDLFKNSKYNQVVFTGHSVFGYFSKRYGVEFISPYQSFSPNSEPSAKDVASLREFIVANDIKYIYYEELVTPKIAKLLEKELGVDALLLHGVHNVNKKEFNSGASYLSIMNGNIERLKLGLEYEN